MYGVRLTRFLLTLLCAFTIYQINNMFGAVASSGRGSYMAGVIIAALFCELQSAHAAKSAFARRLFDIDHWAHQIYSRSLWLRVIVRGFCFLLLYYGLQSPWAENPFTLSFLLKRLVADGVVVLTFGLLWEFLLPNTEQN
jgi:hypothetical protein